MGMKKKSAKAVPAKLKGRNAKDFPRVAAALEKPLAESAATTDEPATAESKKTKRKANEKKRTKVSALDAAAKVLGEKGEPMNCKEMIAAMSEKGYWKSPG